MLTLFRAISDRIGALFATHVALDFEQQLLLHHSDRKADLLRRARQLEDDDLPELAAELRDQADRMSVQRPLASVLPATQDLLGPLTSEPTAVASATASTTTVRPKLAAPGKKRRKAR